MNVMSGNEKQTVVEEVTDLDVVHPERSLLVVAEAELPPEHVEDVLVLHHAVALQTPRPRPPAHDLLPAVAL